MDESGAVGPQLRIHLMGGFRVRVGARVVEDAEWTRRPAKTVVKLLALEPAHRLHRDVIIERLWPEAEPDAALNALHKALHAARRALEPGLPAGSPSAFLRVEGELIALRAPGGVWIDVAEFEAAATTAQQHPSLEHYRAAADRYPGELLPDDRYEDWADPPREALKSTYTALLRALAELEGRHGQHARAAATLDRALAVDPLAEDLHAALMRVHAEAGNRHLALRQYKRLREALRRELGVDPDPAITTLYQAIAGGHFPSEGAAAAPDSPARVVGREAELGRLRELLDQVIGGHGAAVIVRGPAGIGKSRLARELLAAARRRGALTLSGAAYPIEGHLPYGPFSEALSGWLTDGGDASPQVVATLLPDHAARAGIAAPESPLERSRLFSLVGTWLAGVSRRQPVVLTLDDLQSADAESLALLHHLIRTNAGRAALIVGVFRDDTELERPAAEFLTAIGRGGRVTVMPLQPLSADEHERLVSEVLGGPVARALADAVYDYTAGYPLYAEELVRWLHEGGRLASAAGRWELASTLSDVARAPVTEFLSRRLTETRPATRQILGLAAAIGREFSLSLLQRASERPPIEVLVALDEAIRSHLIEERGDRFRFAHPLHREAAYGSLSLVERAAAHGQVARVLERTEPGRIETIASHYTLSDRPARAFPFLLAAAERAAAMSATDTAIVYYREALALMPANQGDDRRPEMLERLGDLLTLTGQAEEAIRCFEAATVALVERPGLQVARLHRKTAYAHLTLDRVAAAAEHLAAARDCLAAGDDPAERAALAYVTAHYHWRRSEFSEALAAAEESLHHAETARLPGDVAQAYEILALSCLPLGDWQRGIEYERRRAGLVDLDRELAAASDVHL